MVQARHFRFWPENVPRTIDIPDRSVYDSLAASAGRTPERAAIIYYGNAISYASLKDQADRLAGYLQQRCGIAKGDRVLLNMQNCPQFVIGYYAILRADAVVVPVNPMNLSDELRHYATDSDARVVITAQELYPQVAPLIEENLLDHAVVACYGDYASPDDTASQQDTRLQALRIPGIVTAPRQSITAKGVIMWRDALAAAPAPRPHSAGREDLCVMPYTSGTTGRPKGCMHTHATVMSTVLIGSVWAESGEHPVVLGTLPLFHVTGMQSCMNGPLYRGATIVLMTRWDRDAAAELIQFYRVDVWTNISTMAIDFLANPRLDDYDLSSLRYISGGGAAMPKAVAERLKQRTGLSYIEGYGLSETMAPTHINPAQRAKPQCLGIPVCSTDARVVDPDTLEELPAGKTGEIVSNGPQVFRGYWKNPQATAAAFIELDGKRFFRTGDLGYCDDEGYFFIVDRLKRMINASGFKVWPAEVESMLYAHPDIHEACVIGSRDTHRGETVKALVVLKEGAKERADANAIIDWAREHMAAYKVPRVIEFVDSLPKSATGKIQWRLLQEQENSKSQE